MELLVPNDIKGVFQYFAQIAAIPHGSGNTGAISDYLVCFARTNGLRYIQEDCGNVIIFKPATKGYENADTVILQGHMDMVCEKESDSSHDFSKDGLDLDIDGDFLFAKGTTLGADDGIALAYALAVLADKEAQHPALECVFTVEEETGMDGAKALDTSVLSGKYLLNLDSEEEDTVLCGCAGGARVTAVLPVRYTLIPATTVKVTVSGLLGGHSGTEIDKNRVNAVKLIARLLFELAGENDFYLAFLDGGNKDNAIPREATAVLATEGDAACLVASIQELAERLKRELAAAEPNLSITAKVEEGEVKEQPVLQPMSFEMLLFFLVQAPNGIQSMSSEVPGLVETSLNLGIFRLGSGEATVHFSLRSSKKSAIAYLCEKLCYLIEFIGGEAECGGEYPAWEYRADSLLRDRYVREYEKVFLKKPEVTVIHAGVECGILSEKITDLDAISIGPLILDIHTTSERLSISSTLRIFEVLEKVLAGFLKK